MGPLLFVTYINDVTNIIIHGKHFLYADDLAVVVSAKDPSRIESLLQEDLNAVGNWCTANKLTVNTEKTQIMWSFSTRSIPDLTTISLKLNGIELKSVPSFNYLGVTLDTHLTLKCQLVKLINLTRLRLSQLRRLRQRTDKAVAIQVYRQMVRPISEYCCYLQDGGPLWASRKLQTLQNDALRACEQIRDPRGINIDHLHTRNSVPTLKTTRNRQLAVLMYKRAQHPANILVPTRALRGNSKIKMIVQREKSDVYSKGPICRGEKLWNYIDEEIQHLGSLQAFRKAVNKVDLSTFP